MAPGDFSRQVYELVSLIPAGKVASYGQIAALMGRPQSGRYVGYALRSLSPEKGDDIPAHRVLRKDGSAADGLAFGAPGAQLDLLEQEGVEILANGKVNMEAFRWAGPTEEQLHDGPPQDFDWAAELGE